MESAEAPDIPTKPAVGEDIMERHKDEIPEAGSESETVKRCRVIEGSDSRLRGHEEGNMPDVLCETQAAETNSRSAPEKTNVLKLETEIRNEYFQAPPLGETLAFQAPKNKCDQAAEPKEANLGPSTTAERKDAAATCSELAECKKVVEIPSEKPGSNSPVRQVLNALQSLSHSRQSPDSDDSPSALEMEDIPIGITCVTSEDLHSRPLVGLAQPPVSFSRKEETASEDLVLDRHLYTDCNTSPEGTDLGLSEEEPEMENVLAEPEAAEVGGAGKQECPGERVYSVSITRAEQTRSFASAASTNRVFSCSKRRWTCT